MFSNTFSRTSATNSSVFISLKILLAQHKAAASLLGKITFVIPFNNFLPLL